MILNISVYFILKPAPTHLAQFDAFVNNKFLKLYLFIYDIYDAFREPSKVSRAYLEYF